jgi:hypothetical protein
MVPAEAPVAIAAFDSARAEIAKWAAIAATIKITDASQTREMKLARDSRLGLVKVRTGAEKVKKDLKGDILKRANAIDAAYNELVGLIKPIEATLLEQETYGERLEAERQARVKAEREAILHQLEVHPAAFPSNLGAMIDSDWAAVQSGHALALEGKRAAEKAAEEARILREKAEAEERERQRIEAARLEEERRVQAEENARLKKEAEALEAKMQAERQAAEEAARVERERVEAATRAAEAVVIAERERVEAERQAERERAERERKAEKEKADAELARLEDERQAERNKAMADMMKLATEAEVARRAAREKADAELAASLALLKEEKRLADEAIRKAESEAQSLRDAEEQRLAAEAAAKKPTRAKYAAMVGALRDISTISAEPVSATAALKALVSVGEA